MFATSSSTTTTTNASTDKASTMIAHGAATATAAAPASPAAEAGVLPILIVLNQFCQLDQELCYAVKEHIFQDGVTKVRELSVLPLNLTAVRATNMKPIIEPVRGSLHDHVNQLITYYHNQFIKRLMNELVYTLCHHDTNEFIVRIGLGNALPFLNTKGIINLPTTTASSMITTTKTSTSS